jgi:nucleoside-diphosphate-sugar epimerase
MKVLVTGASGFIGKALCMQLHNAGHEVIGLVRSDTKDGDLDIFHAVGGMENNSYWDGARRYIKNVEVVFHLASMLRIDSHDKDGSQKMRDINIAGTSRLLNIAREAGVRRFVYLSSISVNGSVTDSRPFTEESAVNPGSAYAQSKFEAEKLIANASENSTIETVIIRPPMVLGKGVKANFFSLMASIMRHHIPLPLAISTNRRSYVSLDSIVSFLQLCAIHDNAANQIFLISDGNLSIKELAVSIRKKLNVSTIIIPVPGFLLKLGGIMIGKSQWASTLVDSIEIDNSKARTLLGWVPVQTKEQVIAETIADLV